MRKQTYTTKRYYLRNNLTGGEVTNADFKQ